MAGLWFSFLRSLLETLLIQSKSTEMNKLLIAWSKKWKSFAYDHGAFVYHHVNAAFYTESRSVWIELYVCVDGALHELHIWPEDLKKKRMEFCTNVNMLK